MHKRHLKALAQPQLRLLKVVDRRLLRLSERVADALLGDAELLEGLALLLGPGFLSWRLRSRAFERKVRTEARA